MLSDYGADVIKVERAAGGDPGRALRAADGYQYYNQAFNRGCGTDRQTDRQSIQAVRQTEHSVRRLIAELLARRLAGASVVTTVLWWCTQEKVDRD